MPVIPQANQLNPAYARPCGTYVELPVISAVRIFIRNSAFGLHDILRQDAGGFNYLDASNLDGKLKPHNYFQSETDVDLLGFGFSHDKWYFTFGIANHSDLLLYYPDDVLSLKDSNLQGVTNNINLGHPGIEATVWNSIGVSASREIMDGLRLGIRVKYLQGMANIRSDKTNLLLNSAPTTLEILLSSNINSSFPVVPGFTPDGRLNSLNFNNAFKNIISDYIFNGNRGISVDAGFVYDYDEHTQFSGSITDLGFIRWRKNDNRFTLAGNYFFSSADIALFQTKPGQADLAAALEDSISRSFTSSKSAYFTLIPIKIFGGATHTLLPKLVAGAMTRIEIYNMHILPSLSLSINYTPLPYLAGSLSYTIMNNKFNQAGAGIALGNRGAQFYVVTDNIPVRFSRNITFRDYHLPIPWPYNARMISLRAGLNLLFTCKEKDDKPRQKKFRSTGDCPAYN